MEYYNILSHPIYLWEGINYSAIPTLLKLRILILYFMHSVYDYLPQASAETIGFSVEILSKVMIVQHFCGTDFWYNFGQNGLWKILSSHCTVPFVLKLEFIFCYLSVHYYYLQHRNHYIYCTLWKVKGCSSIRLLLQGIQPQWRLHWCCWYGRVSFLHDTTVSKYCRIKWK